MVCKNIVVGFEKNEMGLIPVALDRNTVGDM